jgi:hypothetical protein
MKYKKLKTIKSLSLFIVLLSISSISFAQEGTGSSTTTFFNGAILSSENATEHSQLQLAGKPYDEYIIGIYYESKTAVHNATHATNPIVSQGIAYVKCNSENGKIKKGDLITSSSKTGEGMKATSSGLVIGVALEDAPATGGLVKVRVLIQYVR